MVVVFDAGGNEGACRVSYFNRYVGTDGTLVRESFDDCFPDAFNSACKYAGQQPRSKYTQS